MAIAFDAASSATTTTATLEWTHTVGAGGADRFLFVGITWRANDTPAAQTLNTVTYGGQSLTRIGAANRVIGTGNRVHEIWRLINPPTGANTLTATFSAAVQAAGGATSWTGVDQTTPLGTEAQASGHTRLC